MEQDGVHRHWHNIYKDMLNINNSSSWATPSETYDSLWVLSTKIHNGTPTNNVTRLCVTVCPYDSVSGSINTAYTETITINDVHSFTTGSTADSIALSSSLPLIRQFIQASVLSQSLYQ